MLASVQFPLADSRALIDEEVGLLGRPTWPLLFPDYDFVRSFGTIRKRRLGGLSGWVGEGAICEAKRAIRFRRANNLTSNQSIPLTSFSVPFRRFYFDGLAAGKFEVGFDYQHYEKSLTREKTKELIFSILNTPVEIPDPPKRFTSCKFWQAGKHLAKLYLTSSTNTSRLRTKTIENWWVRHGPPLLFLVTSPLEKVQIPFRGMLLPLQQEFGFDLSHYLVPHEGKNIPLWVLNLNRNSNDRIARALRICLLRLHAEHECLKLILQNIATKKILVKPRTSESDILQRYLNEATKRILRLGDRSDDLTDLQVAELARISEEIINPGERDTILDSLRDIDVRRNVFNKVKEYVNESIHIQEQIMGDKYTVGQAGAVGPDSHAHDMHFNQVWNQISQTTDLPQLAAELAKLRTESLKEATLPEHYTAIGALASAESSAKEGDGPKTMQQLANAGKWVLDIASKIGVTVAASAIKESLGIK